MIIGISGKIGSGKDTIAQIIQYLIARKQGGYSNPISEQDFNSYIRNGHNKRSFWQVRKFAYKLKMIVSLMLGIPVQSLEDNRVKNMVLGDGWQIFEAYDFTKKMKWDFATEAEAKHFCETRSNSQHQYTYKKTQRTVRWMLITIGTPCLRGIVHPNAHINMLLSDYDRGMTEAKVGDKLNSTNKDKADDWIVTDVRFINEIKALEQEKGFSIRSDRPTTATDPEVLNSPSEVDLDNYEGFTYRVANKGSISDLIAEVGEILLKEKLL